MPLSESELTMLVILSLGHHQGQSYNLKSSQVLTQLVVPGQGFYLQSWLRLGCVSIGNMVVSIQACFPVHLFHFHALSSACLDHPTRR